MWIWLFPDGLLESNENEMKRNSTHKSILRMKPQLLWGLQRLDAKKWMLL
jgi:hypothetical protein